MDSKHVNPESIPSDPDVPIDDSEITFLVNANVYKQWRSQYVDDNVPSEMGEYCPTFCGGILGFQADVLDSPLVLDQLHHHFDGSLESEINYDSDNEYNYWINPYKESTLSFRELSAPVVPSKTPRGLGSLYSKFIKKFKHRQDSKNKSSSSNRESFFSVREDYRGNTMSGGSVTASGSEKMISEVREQRNDSSSSIYSIQITDYPRTSSEYGNKDRLIDYIYLLNNENVNKRKLMKSALDKIRKGSLDTRPFMRNVEKSRQMSDTFIYNSTYASFPPPPSHHSQLLQLNAEVGDRSPVDNPFFKGQKSLKKKQSGLLSCFTFVCKSKNTNKNKKNDTYDSKMNNRFMSNSFNQRSNQAEVQNAYNQMYNQQKEELENFNRRQEYNNQQVDDGNRYSSNAGGSGSGNSGSDFSSGNNRNSSSSNRNQYNREQEESNRYRCQDDNNRYRFQDDNSRYCQDYNNVEDQFDAIQRYKSDSHIDKFVNRGGLINDLPCINTIPEHSASNSISQTASKMHSNSTNMFDEVYSVDGRDEAGLTEHLPSLEESVDVEQLSIVEATNAQEYTPATFNQDNEGIQEVLDENRSDGTEAVDITPLSDLNKDDAELVTRLSKEISRQLSIKSLDGSVYKLSDVTDFTVLLTEEGVLEVKRILWCLNSYFSTTVEFLPIIPSLCCLLLIYLSPNAVLCVLYRFLNMCLSTSNLHCGSRFFFVNRKGFVTFVTFVLSVMVSQMKKTVEHLRSLKVDLAAWVARSVQTGFSRFCLSTILLEYTGNFIFEGEIVLCRYCVALIKCVRHKLLECTTKDEAEELLYHIGLDPSLQIDKLTKIAFSLRIKKFDKKINTVETPTPYLMNVKIRQFYRPRLSKKSSIVTEKHWEVIWANLKAIYRILDPHNLYSSIVHGNTLLGLTKRILEHGKSSSPALLFVKTTKGHIFGVFIPNLLNSPSKGYFTPQEILYQMNSFVFTLFPYQKMYEFTSKNPTGIKLSRDKIIVGANGPSFILDKTLTSGHTSFSESYDSPPLVSGSYFNVYMVEVWALS